MRACGIAERAIRYQQYRAAVFSRRFDTDCCVVGFERPAIETCVRFSAAAFVIVARIEKLVKNFVIEFHFALLPCILG